MRTRKKEVNGVEIREVLVNNEWKTDAREPSSKIKEYTQIVVIILTSLGIFKGGEITFNSFAAEKKYEQEKKVSIAVDWAYDVHDAFIKRDITPTELAKHVDKASPEFKEYHMSISDKDSRYVKKEELTKVINTQKEILDILNSLKTVIAVNTSTLKKVEDALIRANGR